MGTISNKQTHEQWQTKITAWQKSGKTMKAWCKENNVVYKTFCYWRMRLLSKKIPQPLNSFVEIQDTFSSESGIIVEYRDATLKISKDFDAYTFSKCIQLLKKV